MAQQRLKCKQITRLMQTLPAPREKSFSEAEKIKNKAEVKLLDSILGVTPHS